MAAASSTALSIAGCARFDPCNLKSVNHRTLSGGQLNVLFPPKSNKRSSRRSGSIHAEYNMLPKNDDVVQLNSLLEMPYFEHAAFPSSLWTCESSRGGGGGGDFIAGFLLGGAVFGTLAYVFAPQIRRSLLNEDEYGFQRAKRPIYYDEGLEKTRQTLNEKISQLNSAIDNVSSRLRGGKNAGSELVDADSEVEASM